MEEGRAERDLCGTKGRYFNKKKSPDFEPRSHLRSHIRARKFELWYDIPSFFIPLVMALNPSVHRSNSNVTPTRSACNPHTTHDSGHIELPKTKPEFHPMTARPIPRHEADFELRRSTPRWQPAPVWRSSSAPSYPRERPRACRMQDRGGASSSPALCSCCVSKL